MSAIITDQFRILSADNFVSSVGSTTNSYYAFVGLTNSTDYKSDWEDLPRSPVDSFDNFNDIWDTIIALKKINAVDVRKVIRKNTWESGTTYDIYRQDISRLRRSISSDRTSLYESNYYVINSDFRVYMCLSNGSDPDNLDGKPSLDEPRFTDLEPRAAGVSGDGYIWKYMYTIKPNEIVKFDSVDYIVTPIDWENDPDNAAVRENANPEVSGQIKVAIITNRGNNLGAARVYENVKIVGDGSGASATIVVGTDGTVESIDVVDGGKGYTFGRVDIESAGINGDENPKFDVIIPPLQGHGFDVYRDLGAKNVLIYTRIENDNLNPDFVVGNKIARVGIIKNPQNLNSSSILTSDKASVSYALKLTGNLSSATYEPNSKIIQQVGTGQTAVGRVISFDKTTGVLKYWQDRSMVGFDTGTTNLTYEPEYGYVQYRFSSTGGLVVGETSSLSIQTTFTGVSTTINSKTYNLGQSFTQGISNPEVKKYSGEMIYIDNRPSITRSLNQKEDIKVILQF